MIARDDLVRLLLHLTQVPIGSVKAAPFVASDGEVYSARRMYDAFAAFAGVRPWLPSPPAFAWRLGCSAMDLVRGEEVGAFWQRLTAKEVYAPEGLDDVDFQTLLTLEKALQ